MILNINHIVYESDDSYYITGNERIELTEESEKALIDLIDQRIDERMDEIISTVDRELGKISISKSHR